MLHFPLHNTYIPICIYIPNQHKSASTLKKIDHQFTSISDSNTLYLMTSLAYYHYYLVFSLYLHACTAARPLILSDKQSLAQLQLAGKDHVETSAAGSSDRGSNILQLHNQMLSSVRERKNIGGINIKISYSWKLFHQPTGIEDDWISRRSMVDSSPSNAEENVSSKDNDNVEDIEVMDYAQPHRKPPIHNKGT